MTLIEKQNHFSGLVAHLIQYIQDCGYLVTLGECWRPPEMARIYAERGTGIKNSNHINRLAIDLNIFDGTRIFKTIADFQPIGEWWEQQSTSDNRCAWGGRWGDGPHFSLANGGVA